MAKKNVATQNMNEFGGFGDLMGNPQDSSERGLEELSGETKQSKKTTLKRAVKGAAAGCKVGYTRHTYVLPEQMIDQIKAVSQFFGITESSATEQLVQKGIEAIVSAHGKKAITLQKPKSLFEK